MPNLPVPYSSALGLTRVERRVAKEIALSRAVTSVVAAREEAKIEAIAAVGEAALLSAFDLACLEGALVARNPAFAGKAAYITDRACVGMGNVVACMGRRL